MKVQELIAMLKDMPPDHDVWFAGTVGRTAYAIDKVVEDFQVTICLMGHEDGEDVDVEITLSDKALVGRRVVVNGDQHGTITHVWNDKADDMATYIIELDMNDQKIVALNGDFDWEKK